MTTIGQYGASSSSAIALLYHYKNVGSFGVCPSTNNNYKFFFVFVTASAEKQRTPKLFSLVSLSLFAAANDD